MPHGARTTLATLVLLLGIGAATAEPGPGTTWTDPPARQPAAEAPAVDRKAADRTVTDKKPAKAAASTPAAVTATAAETRPPPATRKADARRASARVAVRHSTPKRRVAASRKTRLAAVPPRAIREPQVVAATPLLPPQGYARYRPYGYGPGYTDERLDRLSSAQAAGYVVVHRRTVLFPDGRTLRVYRPDDGEPF